MRAAVLRSLPAEHPVVGQLPDPSPGPGEVCVAVEACGVCGTDLHILDGKSYRPSLPFVMGHETVGRVVAVGSGVGADWLDRLVAIAIFEGCGSCEWCVRDDERLCPRMRSILGVDTRPGGFAEYVIAPERNLIPLPDAIDAPVAASLVDAGATAANASRRILADSPRDLVVIVGGGPIGYLLAQLLKASKCNVVVAELSAARRQILTEAGIDCTSDIETATRRQTVRVIADCAGAPGVVPASLEALAPGGSLIVVGYLSEPEVPFSAIARKEISVIGIRSGRREDLRRMLHLVATGELQPPVIEDFELQSISEAFAGMRRSDVGAKPIVTPGNRQ